MKEGCKLLLPSLQTQLQGTIRILKALPALQEYTFGSVTAVTGGDRRQQEQVALEHLPNPAAPVPEAEILNQEGTRPRAPPAQVRAKTGWMANAAPTKVEYDSLHPVNVKREPGLLSEDGRGEDLKLDRFLPQDPKEDDDKDRQYPKKKGPTEAPWDIEQHMEENWPYYVIAATTGVGILTTCGCGIIARYYYRNQWARRRTKKRLYIRTPRR